MINDKEICFFKIVEELCNYSEYCKAIYIINLWKSEERIPDFVADYLLKYVYYRKKKWLGF